MKILHTSDWCLGRAFYGKRDTEILELSCTGWPFLIHRVAKRAEN